MQKRWFQLVLSLALIGLASSVVFGQGFRRGGPGGGRGGPGGGGPGGGRGGVGRLESSGLKVGSPMPEVSVFDEEGKAFETASLKGKYSVVVFGCLT